MLLIEIFIIYEAFDGQTKEDSEVKKTFTTNAGITFLKLIDDSKLQNYQSKNTKSLRYFQKS